MIRFLRVQQVQLIKNTLDVETACDKFKWILLGSSRNPKNGKGNSNNYWNSGSRPVESFLLGLRWGFQWGFRSPQQASEELQFTSSLVGCFTSFVVAIDTIHAWELGTSSSPLNGTREAPFSDTPNLYWWNGLVGGFKKQESDGMESETSSSIGRFFEQFETLPVEGQQKLQLVAAFSRQQSGINSAKSSRMSFEHMRDNIWFQTWTD